MISGFILAIALLTASGGHHMAPPAQWQPQGGVTSCGCLATSCRPSCSASCTAPEQADCSCYGESSCKGGLGPVLAPNSCKCVKGL